jgi:hypothetical protein
MMNHATRQRPDWEHDADRETELTDPPSTIVQSLLVGLKPSKYWCLIIALLTLHKMIAHLKYGTRIECGLRLLPLFQIWTIVVQFIGLSSL